MSAHLEFFFEVRSPCADLASAPRAGLRVRRLANEAAA